MASYDCSTDIQNLINHGMTITQIEQEAEAANVRRLYINTNRDGSIHIGEVQNRASEMAWTTWYEKKITALEATATKKAPAKTEAPATTRQVALITKLIAEGKQVAGQPTEWNDVAKLSKNAASSYISQLIEATKPSDINWAARAQRASKSYGITGGGIWDD